MGLGDTVELGDAVGLSVHERLGVGIIVGEHVAVGTALDDISDAVGVGLAFA